MIRLLPVALILLVLLYLVPSGLSGVQQLPRESRRRLGRGTVAVLGVLVTVGVLARFGLGWLGAVGGALLGIASAFAPVLARLFLHRQQHGAGGPVGEAPRGSAMSRSQALQVLGLAEGVTEEEINTAYRQLIRKLHPDTPGGSTYLSAQVNQARAVLLGRTGAR